MIIRLFLRPQLIVILQNYKQLIHCKDTIPKFEPNIPRKGIAQPQSKFPHSCVCERFIYCIPTSSLPILLRENMWTDPGNI